MTIFLIGEPWWMLYLLLLNILNPLDLCLQLVPILCNGRTEVKEHCIFPAVSEFPILNYLIALEPFSERDIFVCVSGIPDCIRNFYQ